MEWTSSHNVIQGRVRAHPDLHGAWEIFGTRQYFDDAGDVVSESTDVAVPLALGMALDVQTQSGEWKSGVVRWQARAYVLRTLPDDVETLQSLAERDALVRLVR